MLKLHGDFPGLIDHCREEPIMEDRGIRHVMLVLTAALTESHMSSGVTAWQAF